MDREAFAEEALMGLNHAELRAHARHYALQETLGQGRIHAKVFWTAFRHDVSRLRSFEERLLTKRTSCSQPAEEWLVDHMAFVETQAQAIILQLSPPVLHRLPAMQDTRMPRIYELCQDYLEQVDGRYDVQSFEAYLDAFQTVSTLTILEGWVLPSLMRVAITRELAEVMGEVRHRHEVCDRVTGLLTRIGGKTHRIKELQKMLAPIVDRGLMPLEVVHWVRHLNEWESPEETVREWLYAYLAHSQEDLNQITSWEHQLQAHLQVKCGDLVTSLHILERQPWRATFKRISRVEQILMSDPTGDYGRLDFSSQDQLRHRVEDLAYRLKLPETRTAETVLQLARLARAKADADADPAVRRHSLAYYLLDPRGNHEVARSVSLRTGWPTALSFRRKPWTIYFGSTILAFLGFMVAAGIWVTRGVPLSAWSWLVVLMALALPMSEWVVTLVQSAIMRWYPAKPLLRYDFSAAVPADARTMVVVPIIWSSIEEVDDVVSRLEVHYLANRQVHIYFAILGDYRDAATETLADDRQLLTHALQQVGRLREKYGADRFFLFHRDRRYNPSEGVFMGWERKRGKLVEFVELLSGKGDTSFSTSDGDHSILPHIRYVFTVDYDTKLPMGVVGRMAGTIHFPYNRPRLNASETRVIEGFGILQPRVAISYESAASSRFAALWAGEPGIDPYAFAVSDPYQNLFGEATFVGKGIFDVDAFLKTVADRVPDNLVLSHDLLEGGFLRTGLTSDIEVVEEHPSSFYAYQRRLDRWIRGDWQLVKWLGSRRKNRYGQYRPVDLGPIARLQILDNLRRSLVPTALFAVALFGLSVLPGRRQVWAIIVLLTIFLPVLHGALDGILGKARGKQIGATVGQSLVQLVTLPFVAVGGFMAMARTLYRLFVSKRNLLQWVPAKYTNRHHARTFLYGTEGYFAIFLYAAWAWAATAPGDHWVGTVLPLLWLSAGPIVRRLNQPFAPESRAWIDDAQSELKAWARQIWDFFEQYVTEQESWLPPDNVQCDPSEVIAHRTSPTNIGLYLVSVAAARDLGFISTHTMVDRMASTFSTLMAMQKWNGHLFNWYDTKTLEPLEPRYVSTVDSGNLVAYLMVVRQALAEYSGDNPDLDPQILTLSDHIAEFIEATDLGVLFNPDERLFCIGYNVSTHQRETALYDLLASEARQTSLVAIALGQVPVSHWFTLGRALTMAGRWKTLLSWSGTMFEYLMPSLILRTYRHTVWESTTRGVVAGQRTYAAAYGVPFGVSESGYYQFDYQLNYQYRAFGVPGLGLNSGLSDDLVVAPYATMIALPYARQKGMEALMRFQDLGAKGPYGFYEAVDFTRRRLPPGSRYEVIKSFMSHHQGMSLLALVNLLAHDVMIARMHRDPHVRAANLLLQERVADRAALLPGSSQVEASLPAMSGDQDRASRTIQGMCRVPEVNVLSNGHLSSMCREDGSGRLTFNGLAVTRWREDPVVSSAGLAIYLRDADSEETWSATVFPRQTASHIESVYQLHQNTFRGTCARVQWQLEVSVHPDMDAEVRRMRVTNHDDRVRHLEITSFLELALADPKADQAHPAYSKLFVETSLDASVHSILAHRRHKMPDEPEIWAIHTVYADQGEPDEYEFETDRAQFIGRNHTLSAPKALGQRLTGRVGATTDPAFVMRRRVRLAPGESALVYLVTGVADSRDGAVNVVKRLQEPSRIDRGFDLAWIRTQVDLHHVAMSPEQAIEAQQWAGSIIYTAPLSHARRHAILNNQLSQSALWSYGLSGDSAITVMTLSNQADMPALFVLARQHQYLENLGVSSDLVILDALDQEGPGVDVLSILKDHLRGRGISTMGNIAVLKSSQLSEAERTLLIAVAQVWLRAEGPSLRSQLRLNGPRDLVRHRTVAQPLVLPRSPGDPPKPSPVGEFFNGWGGFVEEGQAYRLEVTPDRTVPRPWSNVMANARFGCLLTELGTGYTWWKNSRECKLTPWSNDPVLDPPGECLYLYDLDAKTHWSAAPAPAGGHGRYQVTHGWGWTTIEKLDGPISHRMETVIATEDPVKLIRLQIKNQTDQIKRIAVTYYVEWVLGVDRQREAPFIVTEWDAKARTLFAHNTYQEKFRDAIGFLQVTSSGLGSESYSWTGNRSEFIGQGGSLQQPNALFDGPLSGDCGAFASSCGAIQVIIEVPAQGERDVTIVLGCETSRQLAQQLVERYHPASSYAETLKRVADQWQQVTSTVTVRTPDRALDLMLNGWLLYQTLSCRIWARTGFYQAGGAFGFRDQLQDSLAFLGGDPSIVREQILRSAAHQYQEGDVQHWWHEETQKGIRTRISDDLLWLPYAVSRYVEDTEDSAILNVDIAYLESPILAPDEMERYESTVVSKEHGSLLDHCLRAITHAAQFGIHGIPLMGTGDWNDGMNGVGPMGRGESVWLGWMLLDVWKRFARLSDLYHVLKPETVDEFRQSALTLEENLNQYAWDGAWFRRAFTDGGTWLGSQGQPEGQIDAIAQSWSVISGGAPKSRQRAAMHSFDRMLVNRDLRLAALLTDAFNLTEPSPGYIQAYPPGIRENGGQYTHGVVWSVVAWAKLGEGSRATALFSLLNPVLLTRTPQAVLTYGNEPYVMSADIYTATGYEGRGGWSWYTGSAGWMYQAGMEFILGIHRHGECLFVDPCVPDDWHSWAVTYRFRSTTYNIQVIHTPCGEHQWEVDGQKKESQPYLPLSDDGRVHTVRLWTGRDQARDPGDPVGSHAVKQDILT